MEQINKQINKHFFLKGYFCLSLIFSSNNYLFISIHIHIDHYFISMQTNCLFYQNENYFR